MPERYELQHLLWDLRHDPTVASLLRHDPEGTMRTYGLSAEEADAVVRRDFAALLAMEVSPLLLYFGALEMGVSREDYYAAVNRGTALTRETVTG